MCCSNDTAAATGIFTPHASGNKPSCVAVSESFAFILSIPKTCLNCARQPEQNRLDRIHAAEIHQCTIAPQLHAASMDEEAEQG